MSSPNSAFWVRAVIATAAAGLMFGQGSVQPRLRLRAARLRVASGETIRVNAVTPNVPGNWPLNWRADLGSVDQEGRFTAPTVAAKSFARVWACISNSNECGSTVVQVLPFRLEPDPMVLNPGERTRLKAWQAGHEIPAVWRSLSANLTVAEDGTVLVGSGPIDGGKALVAARVGAIEQQLEISVRSPGAVANTAEYSDWLGADNNNRYGRMALGAFSSQAVARGDWIYAMTANYSTGGGPLMADWLDVYRLNERRVPVWMTSVESLLGGSLVLEDDTLHVVGISSDRRVVLTYDVGGGVPRLLTRQTLEPGAVSFRRKGWSFSVTPGSEDPPTATSVLEVTDHAASARRTLPLNYKPLFRYDSVKVVGNQSWAAITYYYPFAPDYVHNEVVVFDISGETAEPIALLPSGGFNYSLTAFENVLVSGSDVYQISGREVTLVSQLPFNFALDADPQRRMLLMAPNAFLQGDGYRVVDLSEPSNPKFSAPAVHSRQYTLGALGSDYFVLVRGPQNTGIYPISWDNRERTVDRFPFSPYMNDLRIRDGLLYWTGYGFGAAGRSRTRHLFQIVDLKTKPSTLLGSADRIGDQVGWAIELNGKYAYVGTDTELVVYDVGNPGNPIETTVIKAPAISLARNGNFLYVGSNSGRTTQLLIYEISDPVQPRLVNTLPDRKSVV